jgi:hypothetical protein
MPPVSLVQTLPAPADFVATYAVPMMPGCVGDLCDTVMAHPRSSLVHIGTDTHAPTQTEYALVTVRGTAELHTALQQDYTPIPDEV